MSSLATRTQPKALKGWRAHAWAVLVFLALFKGLVPHAALASAVMQGDPALVWCAPGASSANADQALPAGMGAAHDCICASAGDGVLPLGHAAALLPHSGLPAPAASSLALVIARGPLPPPARGPPAL